MTRLIWGQHQGTAVRADRISHLGGDHYVSMKEAMRHNNGSRVFRQRKAKKSWQ